MPAEAIACCISGAISSAANLRHHGIQPLSARRGVEDVVRVERLRARVLPLHCIHNIVRGRANEVLKAAKVIFKCPELDLCEGTAGTSVGGMNYGGPASEGVSA